MKDLNASIFLLSLLIVLFIPHPSQTATEQRTALVIGNGAYSSGPLKNPVNDATDMASALRQAGFSVILKTNVRQPEIEEAIESFGNRLKRGGVGLFYFAGHGLQVNGVNYLVPIGVKIRKESDVKYQAIDANRVLDEMAYANNGLNIVILDACRDNPYSRSFRSASRGLAILGIAPTGTFISYSTGPGQVARDGEGRNSPYTSALIQFMKMPGLTIEQVFKGVRTQLETETAGQQVPWELSSLRGEFSFNQTSKESLKQQPDTNHHRVVPLTPSTPAVESSLQNEIHFKLIARKGFEDALKYFQGAVTANPEDVDARAGLVVAMIFGDDLENARYNIRRIRETNQNTRWTRVSLGFIEGIEGDYENGKYLLNRAIEEGADKALAYLCLGAIDIKRNNRKQATRYIENYRSLISINERGTIYHNLSEKIRNMNFVKNAGKRNRGIITDIYGEAVYADLNATQYVCRISRGAGIELLDERIYNSPRFDTIKKVHIKVLSDPDYGIKCVGATGWVDISTTDFQAEED
jgi:hypothetical protein